MNEMEKPKRTTFSPTPFVANYLFQPHFMPLTFSVNRCVIYHILAMEEIELPGYFTEKDVQQLADYVEQNRLSPPMSRGELAALHMVASQDLSEEIGAKIERMSLLERMKAIEAVRDEVIARSRTGSAQERGQ
jgi:hypothetical protein